MGGTIESVAINDLGAGIIGGQDTHTSGQPAYAALVAPGGALTQLSGQDSPRWVERSKALRSMI